ncbi:MAG: glycosyltransferase family 2 protein [Deltaproteobacteria bacterium]
MTHPFVTVIIPARNEERYVAGCLKRVLSQTYPKKRLEILVVDGRSADGTRDIVAKEALWAETNHGTSIRLIDNPNGQRTSAMNIGIRRAKGDCIVRVDARAVIAGDYIEKCVDTLIRTGASNAGGVQRPITERHAVHERNREITQYAAGIALSNAFGIGDARFRLGGESGFVDTVYLGCFRKEVFQKTGLFDEESAVISEDADMNQRIREAGGSVYLNADISAYYYPRDTISGLSRLYFRYGGAKAGLLLKRGRLTAWRQFVPPTFFLSSVFMPVLGMAFAPFYYLWLFMISLYLGLDALVSLRLGLRHRGEINAPTGLGIPASEIRPGFLALFSRLAVIFPAMHFSWATGFLYRLIKRARPGKYWGY